MEFLEDDPNAPAWFARQAEVCIDAARKTMNIDLAYDLPSLNRLDAIVEAIGKPRNLDNMIVIIGSFLGETFRRLYGGRWQYDARFKTWAVSVPKDGGGEEGPLPFVKVEKRFRHGQADSLAFFAHVTDGLVRGTVPGTNGPPTK